MFIKASKEGTEDGLEEVPGTVLCYVRRFTHRRNKGRPLIQAATAKKVTKERMVKNDLKGSISLTEGMHQSMRMVGGF